MFASLIKFSDGLPQKNSTFNTQHSTLKKMKANTWKTILQIAISILTAIATTLGVTSCMG